VKRRISLEELVALVDGNREFVAVLMEHQVIEPDCEGFCLEDVDRALASRTLVEELEVNWAGVDIILRLRQELAIARRRLAEVDARETGD
jgi:hypothetical protein